MGFKKVYQCLIDVFPEVDQRVLRAVAVENYKDVDAAAEIVLTEILPNLSKCFSPSSRRQEKNSGLIQGRLKQKEEAALLRRPRSRLDKYFALSAGLTLTPEKNYCENDPTARECLAKEKELCTPSSSSCGQAGVDLESTDSRLLKKKLYGEKEHVQSTSIGENAVLSNALLEDNDCSQACRDLENVVYSSLDKFQKISIEGGSEQTSGVMSTKAIRGNSNCVDFYGLMTDHCSIVSHRKPFSVLPTSDGYLLKVGRNTKEEACLVGGSVADKFHKGITEKHSPVEPSPDMNVLRTEISVIEHAQNAPEGCLQLCNKHGYDCEFKQGIKMDLLEAAKMNKKTLLLAMDSVLNLMGEVELQEKAAEQVKEEAARGGLDILVRLRELKAMLAHAEEAKDMHQREVFSEKASLTVEARALQACLLGLSDEKDKALAVIKKIQEMLEARLSAAMELMKVAKQEKLGKEAAARAALAEQEAFLETVVKETKMLQQVAEENTKLREFLMDRTRVVDALHEEISAICQDVRSLKEKFDKHVPLSASFLSIQTNCLVASSGSSLNSRASNLVHELCEANIPKETCLVSPMNIKSPWTTTSSSFSLSETSCALASPGTFLNCGASDSVYELQETQKIMEKTSPKSFTNRKSPKTTAASSVSSCLTSRTLASSGTSLKSGEYDLILDYCETNRKSAEMSSTSSINGKSLVPSASSSIPEVASDNRPEEGKIITVKKELLDDGWDFVHNEIE